MDARGEPLEFSNWGNTYQSQGILAPGEHILGANSGGGATSNIGKSFATPIVSGVAALLLSLQLKRGQKPDVVSVRAALLGSALGCEAQRVTNCRWLMAGRLHIKGAVLRLTPGGRTMTEPVTQTDPLLSPAGQHEPAVNAGVHPDGSPVVRAVGGRGGNASELPSTAREANRQPCIQGLGPSMDAIAPSACGCGGAASPSQLVYALGQLGFDFGTEARRDAFTQNMDQPSAGVTPNPNDPYQLLAYLQANPWEAARLLWTLSLEGTPVYAIVPNGAFASEAYRLLRVFLSDQLTEGADRVSIPGKLTGKVRLLNGQTVPVILPEIRGMYNWTTQALLQSVVGPAPAEQAPAAEKEAHVKKSEGVRSFLDRVYFELRNLGVLPQDRATNFAGTNAFNIERVYESAMKEEMDLDSIAVERSPICRPESECWDVKLILLLSGSGNCRLYARSIASPWTSAIRRRLRLDRCGPGSSAEGPRAARRASPPHKEDGMLLPNQSASVIRPSRAGVAPLPSGSLRPDVSDREKGNRVVISRTISSRRSQHRDGVSECLQGRGPAPETGLDAPLLLSVQQRSAISLPLRGRGPAATGRSGCAALRVH